MKAKEESIRLIIFLLSLIVTTSLFTSLRIKDSYYLLSDSGVKKSDLQSKMVQRNFFDVFQGNIKSLLTFDFGKTLTGESVNSHILERLEPTFFLAFFSVTLGSIIAIFTFLYCIYNNNPFIDSLFINLSNLILSTPIFLFAIFLFIFFFLELGLLPPGGYERWNLSYLVLPGVSLGVRTFSRIYLFGLEVGTRELNSPYIRILKTRGFSDFTIIYKYILYKILPLILILIVLDLSSLLSGAMIVEEIFFFPGIGKSTFTAIKNMDENLLRALLLYSGIIFYTLTRFARIIQQSIMNIQEL